jgi:hypothetical protein
MAFLDDRILTSRGFLYIFFSRCICVVFSIVRVYLAPVTTMQLRANRISGDVFEGNSVGEQLTPLTGRRRSVPALSPDIFLQKKIYCIDDSGVVPLVSESYSL